MHVLMTADTVGGVWTYAQELVTALVLRGVRVTLVSLGEMPGAEQTQWMDGLSNLDFRATAFALEWMHDVEHDMQASGHFLEGVIRDVRPDVLHFNQYYYGAIASPIPRVVVAHSDVVSWWLAVHGHKPPATKWLEWYQDMLIRGVQNANCVVAPSRWMLDSLIAIYGKPGYSAVIHNGRNPNGFNPHISKEICVLTVGRVWDSGKQVTLLCRENPPVETVIAGSEQHPDAALRSGGLLERKAALPNVRFKGMQSEAQLRQLYGRAAIYAATSRYEPFGLAPVEAAFSRCAIVANDIPSFRELWGDDAAYFECNHAPSLLNEVQKLATDAKTRIEYGNRAYRRALLRYNSRRMADDYLALYSALLSARSAVA
jgi:glycosyltransferase involved in cell wall biosynthesis